MTVKNRSILLLVIAEITAMSLWFVSSAVLSDMQLEYSLTATYGAALASSVPAGFVVGALLVAVLGIADRFDPRLVFGLASLLAAAFNASLLLVVVGDFSAIFLRFLTGVCLAGVYPVGMKIAVGWGDKDRGWLVGLVVGGLTLGSAAPHLLSFLGGADWRLTTLTASIIAALAALVIAFTQLGPHHTIASKFQASAIMIAWTNRSIRRAFFGYFGHMWELYAMWSWIVTALAVSYSMQISDSEAQEFAKLTAFIAIGGGALMCPLAGLFADKIGKAKITIIAMSVSGLSALFAALFFGGPIEFMFIIVLIWGLSIIPDSAQFSALIADYSPRELSGSIMTLQTALGFALTIMTIQLTPIIANIWGWPTVFVILALGPLLGILAMVPLTKNN
ncbi:MAG: hypothetical protein V7749_07720 [Cocleimonas sp.]